MTKTEQEIKSAVSKKVYDSACDLLDKHKDAPMITVNDDEHGAVRSYKKPVADALLLKKRASKPKKYFFMSRGTK